MSEARARPRRTLAGGLFAILLLAALLRLLFPLADPPWRTTVGIVWHDEGAWTHNARNKALFGTWQTDAWNPMYVAPVFTGLEYASFRVFGVGLWQARLVSQLAGLASVWLVGLAVARAGGIRAGLFAAALIATNYVYVMWNRAALLEGTMVAFMVVALYAYARAERQPPWGILAGCCAWLAFFSKAAAAFFIPAIAVTAAWPVVVPVATTLLARSGYALGAGDVELLRAERRGGLYTLAGLALGGVIAAVVFVWPNWQEYWFYNWQMSVTRKPTYTLQALQDRVSWFPVLHDSFTRMYLVLVAATIAVAVACQRWFVLPSVHRLLVAWVVFGVAELLAHDVGNERRLLFLVPAMSALTALLVAQDPSLLGPHGSSDRSRAGRGLRWSWMGAPLLLYAAYVVAAPLARLPFLYEVRPAVRLAAGAAIVMTVAGYVFRVPIARAFETLRRSPAPVGAAVVVALVIAGDLIQFTQWAAGRTVL